MRKIAEDPTFGKEKFITGLHEKLDIALTLTILIKIKEVCNVGRFYSYILEYTKMLYNFFIDAVEIGHAEVNEQPVPDPLCSQYTRPDKDEAIKTTVSRFCSD